MNNFIRLLNFTHSFVKVNDDVYHNDNPNLSKLMNKPNSHLIIPSMGAADDRFLPRILSKNFNPCILLIWAPDQFFLSFLS